MMNKIIKSESLRTFYIIVIGFLSGAFLLCSISVIQKIIAGYNHLLLKGYIIPFLFGGSAGSLIGFYLFKVKKLTAALLQRVDNLESILPICSHCKKIRKPDSESNDNNSWQQLESYISDRTTSKFSHGICPNCKEKFYDKEYLP